MAANQAIYDELAGAWWEEDGCFSILRRAVNPVRFGYFRGVLEKLGIDPAGKSALDIGCGGGFLTEEFAGLGFRVSGIDPSRRSLDAARAHAAPAGLDIDYRAGSGEDIPFPDSSFDVACCCDVLEHVGDVEKVIAETARVLKPGGLYFYDTINRTPESKLVIFKLFQEWSWTSFLPARLHDWNLFIKPAELHACMTRHGLENQDLAGVGPGGSRLCFGAALLQRKLGCLTYSQTAARMKLRPAGNTRLLYMGYAIRRAALETMPQAR